MRAGLDMGAAVVRIAVPVAVAAEAVGVLVPATVTTGGVVSCTSGSRSLQLESSTSAMSHSRRDDQRFTAGCSHESPSYCLGAGRRDGTLTVRKLQGT